MNIVVNAEIPDESAQAFLQHIRDFDAAHPGCKFEILAHSETGTMGSLMKIIEGITPAFDVMAMGKIKGPQ